MLQEYRRCAKQIAITSAFDVKDGKTLRMLEPGELVEILEVAKTEESSQLPRAKCRALSDCSEGWVSLRGNQGTAFLEHCGKPYYCVGCDGAALDKDFEAGAEVRKLAVGEVIEVVEGPRRDELRETLRVKVRCSKDGKEG